MKLGLWAVVTLGNVLSVAAAAEDPNDPAAVLRKQMEARPPRQVGEVVDIGSRRELFCDDFLVNRARTTATRVLHHPELVEDDVLRLDKPWEGNACSYGSLVKDGDVWRLYYIANHSAPAVWAEGKRDPSWDSIKICYMVSKDGRNWERPNLGRYVFNGSKDNNIFFMGDRKINLDNQMVFKDPNPDCRPGERFKGAIQYIPPETGREALWLFAGDNPSELKPVREIIPTNWKGGGVTIDSQNVIVWDPFTKRYHLYVRGYHANYADRNGDYNIRDIRHAVSTDTVTWTEPQFLDFGPDAEDYPLYTNGIQPYERAPHIFVGFPTRYNERKKWTPSYDCLPSPEERRTKMKVSQREGLNLSDIIFMCSRDGQRFTRYDEAFMRPGPEARLNWKYLDCYIWYGLMITPGRFGRRDSELSLYSWHSDFDKDCTVISRHVLRLDGFTSYHGSYFPQHLVTRPLRYAGSKLYLNFATSARGYIRIVVRDAGTGREARSCEVFGDATDRPIAFETGSVAELSGRPVTLDFELSDADIYALRFAE